jgi:tRNA threonylcarbamoyladenosine modification (KEOPS) complex Cgi121 subunit
MWLSRDGLEVEINRHASFQEENRLEVTPDFLALISKIALRRGVSATATSYEKEEENEEDKAGLQNIMAFLAATHDRPVLLVVATCTLLREWKRHTPYRRHCQVEIPMRANGTTLLHP